MTTPLHRPRMAFRRWRRTRPFWAGVWTLLGGAIIAFGPLTAIKLLFLAGQTVWLGALVGVLIAVCGLFFWIEPQFGRVIGVLVILLAILSLITSDLGGFLIGMLLALTGGALGAAWTHVSPKPVAAAVPASSPEADVPVAASSV